MDKEKMINIDAALVDEPVFSIFEKDGEEVQVANFMTSTIHKSSYTGKFSYSRNFYAKDADELNIQLPTNNQQPDYSFMQTLISAVQKLVIKEVVLYADKKIAATRTVVDRVKTD